MPDQPQADQRQEKGGGVTSPLDVMRGLDPRIHFLRKSLSKGMDCRVKPGNDDMNRECQ
jgi:hypothetical protein